MRIRSLGAILVALSVASVASSQSQTSDTLQNLKNSLSPDQQSSILQEVLGGKGGSGTGKKTDPKLDTPETVRRKNGTQTDFFDKEKYQKTPDGRILRQSDEDPELRPSDTVLIEMISSDDLCNNNPNQFGYPNNNGANGNNGPNGATGIGGINGISGINGITGVPGVNPAAGNLGVGGNSGILSEGLGKGP